MDSQGRKPDMLLTVNKPSYLSVAADRRVAYVHRPGLHPGLLFCGGFMSDMTGIKATSLARRAAAEGQAFTRFDYQGHGMSDGRFDDGTISNWIDDALAVVDRVTFGPLVIIGSSMGAWVMLHLALARPQRVVGLVGIGAAPDFTEDLICKQASTADQEQLMAQGFLAQPSAYNAQPYKITRRLIEDGRQRLLLRGPIEITCPVYLLHGQEDHDVPWETSIRLANALRSRSVTLELIKSGDHRLSTPRDLDRIWAAIRQVMHDQPSTPAVRRSCSPSRYEG